MADPTTRAAIVTEMATLRKQQLESSEDATYVGWTKEAKAAHEKRADRVAALLSQLANLDGE